MVSWAKNNPEKGFIKKIPFYLSDALSLKSELGFEICRVLPN